MPPDQRIYIPSSRYTPYPQAFRQRLRKSLESSTNAKSANDALAEDATDLCESDIPEYLKIASEPEAWDRNKGYRVIGRPWVNLGGNKSKSLHWREDDNSSYAYDNADGSKYWRYPDQSACYLFPEHEWWWDQCRHKPWTKIKGLLPGDGDTWHPSQLPSSNPFDFPDDNNGLCTPGCVGRPEKVRGMPQAWWEEVVEEVVVVGEGEVKIEGGEEEVGSDGEDRAEDVADDRVKVEEDVKPKLDVDEKVKVEGDVKPKLEELDIATEIGVNPTGKRPRSTSTYIPTAIVTVKAEPPAEILSRPVLATPPRILRPRRPEISPAGSDASMRSLEGVEKQMDGNSP